LLDRRWRRNLRKSRSQQRRQRGQPGPCGQNRPEGDHGPKARKGQEKGKYTVGMEAWVGQSIRIYMQRESDVITSGQVANQCKMVTTRSIRPYIPTLSSIITRTTRGQPSQHALLAYLCSVLYNEITQVCLRAHSHEER
jgi:hypothetical protein